MQAKTFLLIGLLLITSNVFSQDPNFYIYGYLLGQNYLNPSNGKTNISFEIPTNTYVSLKVYNMLGTEIIELAGKEYSQGKHIVEFNTKNRAKGIYIYTIKADKFSASQKMIVQGY